MSKFEHFLDVRYYETDQMGIVHHSNYIRFMEDARIDYLEQIGYPYSKMEEEGVISPVVAVECKFKSPSTFSDEIVIDVALNDYTGVKFVFEYEMKNKKTDVVVAVGKTEHCFTNPSGLPIIIKKRFPELHEHFSKLISK